MSYFSRDQRAKIMRSNLVRGERAESISNRIICLPLYGSKTADITENFGSYLVLVSRK